MKNILLIGDSILVGSNQTSGYGTIVRDMLKDKANVYIPLDNARYTMYTLRNLAGWIDAMPREKMDIVQWNNLEWDIGEFYQDGPLGRVTASQGLYTNKRSFTACCKHLCNAMW